MVSAELLARGVRAGWRIAESACTTGRGRGRADAGGDPRVGSWPGRVPRAPTRLLRASGALHGAQSGQAAAPARRRAARRARAVARTLRRCSSRRSPALLRLPGLGETAGDPFYDGAVRSMGDVVARVPHRRVRPVGGRRDRQAAGRPVAAGRGDEAGRLRAGRRCTCPAALAGCAGGGRRSTTCCARCSGARGGAGRARWRSRCCRSRSSPRAATRWTPSWPRWSSSALAPSRARAARRTRPWLPGRRRRRARARRSRSSSFEGARRRAGARAHVRGSGAAARAAARARALAARSLRAPRSRSRGWSRCRCSAARHRAVGVRVDGRVGVERRVRLRRDRAARRARPARGERGRRWRRVPAAAGPLRLLSSRATGCACAIGLELAAALLVAGARRSARGACRATAPPAPAWWRAAGVAGDGRRAVQRAGRPAPALPRGAGPGDRRGPRRRRGARRAPAGCSRAPSARCSWPRSSCPWARSPMASRTPGRRGAGARHASRR